MKSEEVNRVDLSLDDIIRMDRQGQRQDKNNAGNNGRYNNNNNNNSNNSRGGTNNRSMNNNRTANANNNNYSSSNNNNNKRHKNQSNYVRGMNNNMRGSNGGGNYRGLNRRDSGANSSEGNNSDSQRGENPANRWGRNKWANNQNRGQGQSYGGTGISPLNRDDTDSGSVMSVGSSRQSEGDFRKPQGIIRRWKVNQEDDQRGGIVSTRANGLVARSSRLNPFVKKRGFHAGIGMRQGLQRGTRGVLPKPGIMNQSSLSCIQNEIIQRQNQGLLAMVQMTAEQKQHVALQALREARLTIALLDQQAARQNLFNSQRGIMPEETQTAQSQGMYSSMTSLASTSSHASSSSSSRQLHGTQVSAFHSAGSQGNKKQPPRWRQPKLQMLSRSSSASTLTISINNPESVREKSTFRQQHHHQHHQKQQQRQQRWQENRNTEELDLRRGATPSFSQQLSQLKPTVAMKYVFQKNAFSSASTPFSLNDRFSIPEDEDLDMARC